MMIFQVYEVVTPIAVQQRCYTRDIVVTSNDEWDKIQSLKQLTKLSCITNDPLFMHIDVYQKC